MTKHGAAAPRAGLHYLNRADVVASAAEIDPVAVARTTLAMHAEGRTTLPDEAYLGWQTADGATARSLALPGAIWGDEAALGTKIICSSLANPARGISRAHGLIVLFDRETARPVALMEGAFISALRTSAYTALSVSLLGPPRPKRVAIIGCGALGEAHVRLLASRVTDAEFVLYDQFGDRRDLLNGVLARTGIRCRPVASARDAVDGADVVVTATTTTEGYLRHDWLAPGVLIAHVSLDDVLPDVVASADLLVVDDWPLVSGDPRRLLGRMYRRGELSGPGGEMFGDRADHCRPVDATLGDVVVGRHPGRTAPAQIVLSNPFGMGVLDVAMAAAVLGAARAADRGVMLSD